MKKLPYISMENGAVANSCPPDGIYAVIGYGGDFLTRKNTFSTKPVFPWHATIYVSKDGGMDQIAIGSNVADILSAHEVDQVYLVGIDDTRRKELFDSLKTTGIELVEAGAAKSEQEEALEFLKGLRPTSGSDPDFDYEKGESRT